MTAGIIKDHLSSTNSSNLNLSLIGNTILNENNLTNNYSLANLALSAAAASTTAAALAVANNGFYYNLQISSETSDTVPLTGTQTNNLNSSYYHNMPSTSSNAKLVNCVSVNEHLNNNNNESQTITSYSTNFDSKINIKVF